MIKHQLPVIGRLYRQRDASRTKVDELIDRLRKQESAQRLYVLEGVLLELPLNIISDKFHSDLLSGTYEGKELAPIRQNLKPDDIVLELGAAVGFISTWVAKLLRTGRVVTYEANPNMIPVASNNHRINCVNVELNHALVTSSHTQGPMEFYVDKTFFWDSGVVPRAHDNGSVREKILVKTRRFSDILKEVDPTILIVDIEGGEVGLFDGLESLGKVRHIFFELHAFIGPLEIHRIFSRLEELGFSYDGAYSSGYVATFTADTALDKQDGKTKSPSRKTSTLCADERATFSQFGEDVIVGHLYPTIPNGRYLDVGCYHPYRFSNTSKLHSRGWSGVNIDANPKTIELFNLERSADINLNVVVGAGPKKEVAFYILDDDSPSNTLSLSFAEAQARSTNANLPEPIIVKQVPLSEVMATYFSDAPPLYLNIDAEATDLEVLKSGDWQAHRPPLVSVEDGAFLFDEPASSDLYRFMRSINYVMYSRCHGTSFFVDKAFWKYVQHGGSLEQGLV